MATTEGLPPDPWSIGATRSWSSSTTWAGFVSDSGRSCRARLITEAPSPMTAAPIQSVDRSIASAAGPSALNSTTGDGRPGAWTTVLYARRSTSFARAPLLNEPTSLELADERGDGAAIQTQTTGKLRAGHGSTQMELTQHAAQIPASNLGLGDAIFAPDNHMVSFLVGRE